MKVLDIDGLERLVTNIKNLFATKSELETVLSSKQNTLNSMTASEATTGTSNTARSISAKVMHDKISSSISTGSSDGTISVNGTDVNVKGLKSGAYAEEYTHPTSAGNKHIPTGGSSGNILVYSAAGTAAWGTNAPTATSAGKLTTGVAIDGVTFDGSAAIIHYGTCSTAAATAAKTVACTSYTLVTGSVIYVKFTVTNTAANPTLNVNSTGAKAIQYRGSAITAGNLAANRTYAFIYDGTNYQLVGDVDTVYTHPTTAGNKHIPTGGSTGQILKYGGSSGTASWGTLSASDVGAAPSDIDTGVMSVTASSTNGKVSVDGTDVDVYAHPTTAGNKHIPSGGSSGQILKYSAAGTAAWGTLSASDVGASPTDHTHTKSDITDFPTIPTITDTYSGTSSNGMSGKAVKSAIDSALTSAYKPSGSIAYASLPTLSASVMGNVYNVTNSFTIDNRFIEYDSSKTQTFPAGTEVAVINTGTSGSPTYKFSVMSGFIDLSGYQLANTAVTHTASTAAGSSKKPVYINSSGVATEISYTIEKSVPSNAVFTDTKYTGSDGITLTDTNFTNSGVRAVSASSTNGKVKVNTNGTESDETVYTHPTTAGNKHIPTGGSSGQILRWSSSGTAVWGAENDTTYSDFVGSGENAASGLVPKPSTTAGTTKYLCENGTWAVPPDNNTIYTHPTTSGNKHIPSGGSSGQILKWSADGTATWAAEYSYTHPTTAGNKHIPSGGSTGQILVYGGSSGTAAWNSITRVIISSDSSMPNTVSNGDVWIQIVD